jgi:hypothetical protein
MRLCFLNNGYALHVPTSGGKAGKNCNKTSTVQLRLEDCVKKQFRFTVNDKESFKKAVAKAKKYALGLA